MTIRSTYLIHQPGDKVTDTVTPAIRSRMMRAVKSEHTKPELEVRRALHLAGFRYRLHRADLPGRPDIVLSRYKIAVFVHGCFWHGHDCPRGKRPLTNRKFWERKIGGNILRDARNQTTLIGLGWKPVVIWTCDLQRSVQRLLGRLNRAR
jgi:DNA mismatch endonuclease, patch repair protein